MAAAMGSNALSSVAGAYANAQAYKSQGNFQNQIYKFNSQVAKVQAEDALKRGEESVTNLNKSVKKLVGSQRASLAAQGISLESGTPLELQQDTAYMGALDAITIRNNAYREAWGYKSQAISSALQGEFASLAGQNNYQNTLLTGGLQGIGYLLQGGSYLTRNSTTVDITAPRDTSIIFPKPEYHPRNSSPYNERGFN